MNLNPRMVLSVAALALCLAPVPAHARFVRTGAASVAFATKATGGLKIKGTTQSLNISEHDNNIVFTVPLATLRTGIGLRDRHMREKFLETARYPDAVLVVPKATIKLPPPQTALTAATTGAMTIHGQTQPVVVNYSLRRDGGQYAVSGAATIDIRHFGIKQPSYLGVKVDPVVKLSISFTAKVE